MTALVPVGTTVFLFATKSSILTLAARTAKSWYAYVTELERAVVDGVEQIHETLRRIESGASIHRGLDPAMIARYVPMSVVSDFPVDPITYAFVRASVNAKGWLTHTKASPLQILELAEVEMLETARAASRDLLSLFDRKLLNENYQAMPFKNFCMLTGEAWVYQHNPYLEHYFRAVEDGWHSFFARHHKPSCQQSGSGPP